MIIHTSDCNVGADASAHPSNATTASSIGVRQQNYSRNPQPGRQFACSFIAECDNAAYVSGLSLINPRRILDLFEIFLVIHSSSSGLTGSCWYPTASIFSWHECSKSCVHHNIHDERKQTRRDKQSSIFH